MSANISDVARIQDEDVLRKMWQDTDDFGRKKEIRSHMYKLREARLKDFYNSADVNNTEIHRSTTTSTASKTNMSTTHADLLADQSYVTLKSKEVRDSESPTRDSYNKSIVKHQDQGWNINTSHEKSLDGKTHTSKHTATTSGTQKLDGGKLDYAAKLEEKSSVFQDGDDKNFTRAVGTSSSSAVRQEASGGDEHSNFRSTSSKTSSSSTYASESRHASEDIKALPSTINEINAKSISEKTYTTNIPHELKNHPNYVEGKTKVTQETKTLADGTVVTTTKYETKQGNSTETATHKKYSNIASSHSEQRTSSSKTHQESSRNTYNDSTVNRNDQRAIEYIVEPDSSDSRRFSNQQTTKTTQSEQTNRQHQQTTKTTQNEQVNRQNQRIVHQDNVDYIPSDQNVTTKTTTTRNVVTRTPQEQTDISKHHRVTQDRVEYVEIPVDQFVKTTKTTITDQVPSNTTYHTTSTHVINQKNDTKNDQFISTERQHEVETREAYPQQPKPSQEPSRRQPNEAQVYPQSTPEPERYPKTPQEPHVQPDRRQPIRPGKSELDQKPTPTDGQYDTTYRHDYTSKKISVEVSATHDAFARSLRSITPERITRGSPRTNSNASLRSNTSPEKMRYPSRTSPERNGRSRSPKKAVDKFSSTETITYSRKSPDRYSRPVNGDIKTTHYSTDTSTRKSKIDSIDSSTLTRKKTTKPRSPSPTGTTTSDFEYIRSTKDVTTDLDDITVTRKDTTRPSSLDITTRKIKKVTERSPTSPLTDLRRSPTKDSPTPTNERPKLVRTDTYEERVKEILGLNKDTKETRRSSLERSSIKRSSFRETSTRTSSSDDVTRRLSRSSPVTSPENQYPNKRSPVKEKSPEKSYLDRRSPSKEKQSQIPSQSRKSPEKQPLERKSPTKSSPSVSEFRKSPEKEPLEPYPERRSPTKTGPTISEFPAQIRKSPEKEPLEPYPERRSPTKTRPTISEFPAQTRKSPEKEPLEPYPERRVPSKTGPTISEFPAQTRKSPEREPLEPYPERRSPSKTGPTISEFPAQTRKYPGKEPLEPYPERRSPTKTGPTISEFPAQTRKSPEREPLEPYPERRSPTKTGPTISEFPAQTRKSPGREPLEPYPERSSPTKTGPTISEFPSQTRKSPEREPLEPYPERRSPTKTGPTISEFPSQIRISPEREPLEPYPEKTSPTKTAPSISEFPSQIRKSPEKDVLEPYPERKSPTGPTICEFPSQVRKTPEREPLEPYPEKTSPSKYKPEFPSHLSKSPEPSETYPEKKSPGKNIPKPGEKKPSGISQPKKSPIYDAYPEKKKPKKEAPTIAEFPSQTRKSPEKPASQTYPEKKTPRKYTAGISAVPSQIKPSPKTKKPRKDSESSTSENEDIEETITQKTVETVETRIPVEEPVLEKKIFSQLCKADEVRKIDHKKTTQELIESEILESEITKQQTSKTVRKDKPTQNGFLPKRPITKKLPEVTKTDNPTSKVPLKREPSKEQSPIKKTPSKKLIEVKLSPRIPTPKKQPQTIYRVEKTKFVGATEYQDEYSKISKLKKEPVKKPVKPTTKTTLYDIEQTLSTKEDKSVHIRTNRVDDTVTKKKVTKTIMLNGDAPKPKGKIPSPINKAPVTKATEVKPKQSTTVTQSRYSTTVKKTVNEIKPKSKLIEPKKHTVTTRITVAPTKKTITKKEYVSSDDEESVVESVEGSFIDLTNKDTDKETTKRVITTKTVLITNEPGPDREIIVNLQRSKSSREPTPDRLCPRPLTSDEEEDATPARYPDQISEPDEGSLKRKPKKLSDMPIFETETDFNENATRITEMSSRITKVDKVEETDESLLSINKKINKFLNTADQLTKEPLKPKPGKVERPSLVVSEDLQEDECLLSVSDKVSKFISTAEQLTTDRSRSTKTKSFDVNVNIQQKVSDFNTSVEESQKPKTVDKGPAPKVPRPDLEDVEDDLKEDECLLSVSDKVSKFISTAEKLTTSTSEKPTVSLSKMEVHPSRSPTKDVTSEFIDTEKRQEITTRKSPERISFASPETKTPTKQRSPSPDYKTPDRKPSNEYASILKTGKVETDYYTSSSPESTPKSSRKVQDDSKSTTRLRSTESIKRAKALFENIGKDHDTPWQKDILSRPSVFDAKKSTKTTSRTDVEEKQEVITRKSSTQKVVVDDTVEFIKSQSPERPSSPGYTRFRPQSPEKEPESSKRTSSPEYTRYRPKSPEKEPHSTKKPLERATSPDYTTFRPKSPEKEPRRATSPEYTRSRPKSPEITYETSKRRSREPTPEGELPHYMKPLDRSLRPNSPHRDSINQAKPQQHEPQTADQVDTRQTKFGVTLRRTDSGRTTKTTETSTSTTERRKSSITLEKRITEEEIEEIFEIEVLEELLEKVVGYELRRKIRTQIRLVKKLISEGTLESYITKRRSAPREAISRRGSSPAKTVKPSSSTTSTTEYQTTYVRKASPEPKRSASPSKTVKSTSSTTSASEYQSTYVRKTSPERKTLHNKPYEPTRGTSPAKTVTSVSTSTEYVRKPSPERKILDNRPNEPRRGSSPAKTVKSTSSSEYQSSYVRKTSPERKNVDNKLYQHTDIVDSKRSVEQSSSEYQSSYKSTKVTKSASPVRDRSSPQKSPERRVSKTVDLIPEGKVTTVKTTENIPGGTKTTTTKTTEKSFTTLKKTAPLTKKPIEDSQPEWVRQRNLRNAKESAAPVNKKVSSSTSTTTTKKSSILRTSPAKEVKGTDIITSSYGVGPTDENGTPLFGLKALRAQNKNEKIKVQGTVIRSEYYSENDQEPVGQVSVTKYSNDPRDLDQDGPVSSDGKVTSVTTTQKFGYKDTPSLRSLTDNKKEICDSSEKTSSTTTKTTKVNRRGSVKEMSKKFIDNAVETLKSERQTTYPKAGLILRSSSFKSTNGEGEPDSRELSPADDREAESSTVTVRTMKTTSSSSGETFLTNKSKISGVQDVITRMKNEEYGAEGDSEEDVAARGLLNKFLGAQVILSGMESHAASSNAKTTTSSSSPEGTVRRTTKITTTVTEGGKPTTTTRVFLRPVTEKELETVWDEQSLQVLLEQSTDYEERRIIRLKLRQVMAEQEESVETTKEVKSEGDVTTTKVTTTKVTQQQQQVRSVPKPISPFAKFRQLDKQNSANQPTPPSTPGTPRGSGPLFKFTDPALSQSASTIKDRLLHWCRMKTKEYENIQLDNFSSSWADGLAFCALIHHFLPEAFDYSILTPKDRKHNFELAFRIADEKADIFPLLDVEDMLETRRPDWKCVFTYVQSIYRRFKDED